jgi:hypothetical protein
MLTLDVMRHVFTRKLASAVLTVLGSSLDSVPLAALEDELVQNLPQLHAEGRLRFTTHESSKASPRRYYGHSSCQCCQHCSKW